VVEDVTDDVETRLAEEDGRVRRESCVGPWLPEPEVTPADPADRVSLDDSVRYGSWSSSSSSARPSAPRGCCTTCSRCPSRTSRPRSAAPRLPFGSSPPGPAGGDLAALVRRVDIVVAPDKLPG
jgi:hypothetical protein